MVLLSFNVSMKIILFDNGKSIYSWLEICYILYFFIIMIKYLKEKFLGESFFIYVFRGFS